MAAGESSTYVRIVLLGNREAGKSSAGNTILGREEFDPDVRTLQCVKRQGEVAGRQVTVVDTPGWTDYDHIYLIDSCNLIKQQIVLSVSLCPPGPHAVLIVIHENTVFSEDEKIATSNHLNLLGQAVWKHTLVLFIQETPAEENAFEVKGKMLQWLVEKCGNRYHVLNIKNKDGTQVTELLEKIEEMVAGNNRQHYEMERQRVEELKDRRREEEEEREQERRMKRQRERESFRSSSEIQFQPDIGIVLLGCKGAGKSSLGNTLLGREEFQPGQRSAVCVKRQGEVAGRQVTVVEAPGWWNFYPVMSSSEMTRNEIALSQGLCGEGPHCFFVVLRADASFTKAHRVSAEQHVNLLSERVWSHTMVLFTHGDWLGDTTIEQHIESEGEDLKWLLEKCKNRYHVLNNHKNDDADQVKELLEKIEETTAGLLQMDRDIVEKVSRWRTAVDLRAEERVKRQKERIGPFSGIKQLPSLRIVLLGTKYQGKTSAGNTIFGRHKFELRRTAACVKRRGEVAGRQVSVVDVPGWWRSTLLKDSPELIKQEIVLSVSLCPPGPHAILLVICVDISFTEKDRTIVQEHLELLGERVWSHTMVLFTFGNWLGDTTIEQYIESEGESLQWIIEKCGNRYHIFDNDKLDDSIQRTQLLEKIEEMVAGNGGCPFEVDKTILQEVEKKRSHLDTRVDHRETQSFKQEATFKFVMGEIQPLSEISIVHLHYAEKSAQLTQLNREDFLSGVTLQCETKQWNREGREVATVDVELLPSTNTLEQTKGEFVSSLSNPHAFVLDVSIDFNFTEKRKMEFKTHFELLGNRVWDRAIVGFQSSRNLLDDWSIEKHIESEGEALQWLVEKCGNRYILWTGEESWSHLLKKIDELVALNGGGHFQYDEEKTNETKAADWKMEVQQLEELKEENELANSIEIPPNMGGDKRSEITSVTSAYHTHISDTASEVSSERDSVMSAATSSGIGSLTTSGRQEGWRDHKRPAVEEDASSSEQRESPEETNTGELAS
ncbi:GTPase IMAP family member 8-like [Sardina pilchardus]|uniref:GTPase IMAP family member 8-like n=1 Tax=Sardina pilchardus TaxID=27697 RepID=UPI002E135956